MSVEGQLRDLGVVDVLHLICLRRKPAQLTVMRGGATGRVVVGEGQIVHARLGALTGEGAVVELLRWRDGIFKVSEAPALPERNVRANLTELMTRAASGGSAADPGAAAPAEAGAPRADRELDEAMVQLFARLEREVARFESLRPGPRCAGQAIAILEAILERTAETGAAYVVPGFDDAGLRRLVLRQAEIAPALQNSCAGEGRISLAGVRELLDGMPGGDPRRELYGGLAAGAIGLVNGLFAQLGRSLGDDELRQQWRETFEAFLADLTAAVDTVRI